MFVRAARQPLRLQWLRSCTSSEIARRRQIWHTLPTRSLSSASVRSTCQSNGLISSHWRTKSLPRRTRNHRTFLSATAQAILTPPLVFVGLLLTLWTYKCIMMVLFQDKIIYMPSMPPFSRSEKIQDYANECKPVTWEEQHIKSIDGTKIALCVGSIPQVDRDMGRSHVAGVQRGKRIIICYFQGNGSSTPPRLPILSNVLKSLQANNVRSGNKTSVEYRIVALSYRGYWTSSGRASQSGIELDAQALLNHVAKAFRKENNEIEIVLWGQSVGSGVATTAAAKYLAHRSSNDPTINGLVLETPFSGIKSMLIAMYPQKWLPYRYLWPFLWNHWDSETALRQLSALPQPPRILLLPATRDEVVPAEEADKLEQICRGVGLEYERKDVMGALHNEATVRRDGQQSIANFIANTTHK